MPEPAAPGEGRWSEEQWRSIRLDRSFGEDTLGFNGMEAFHVSLADVTWKSQCLETWKRPERRETLKAEWEIRLRPTEKGYEVEDARLIDATASYDDLEACLRASFIGTPMAVADADTYSREHARVVFPVLIGDGRPVTRDDDRRR